MYAKIELILFLPVDNAVVWETRLLLKTVTFVCRFFFEWIIDTMKTEENKNC